VGWSNQVAEELVKLTVENPTLRDGALSAAFEEYVEAKCFCHYLDTGRLLPRQELSAAIQKHEYLGGVIDFTGAYLLPGSS
jgi:predicted translin family RNA/ssDNA-binding protein